MAAVREQVGPRPRAGRRLVNELPDELVAREDEQVDIAPVILLAAAQRTDQGHAVDRHVSFQQPEQLPEEAVTEFRKQRRPVRNPGDAGGAVIHRHSSFRSPLLHLRRVAAGKSLGTDSARIWPFPHPIISCRYGRGGRGRGGCQGFLACRTRSVQRPLAEGGEQRQADRQPGDLVTDEAAVQAAHGAALSGTPLVPGGRGRRLVAAVSGAALLSASAATRWGVFHAGMASARDPKYTVVPQRQRLDERRAAEAGPASLAEGDGRTDGRG